MSAQYRYALIHLALAHLKERRPEKALEDLEASLTYPTILGEGKLPNVPDNQAHYYMGMAYRMMGNIEKAEVYLELVI
ncbi:MAG: tetratricopeptide repeat protein [Clostridiales bacterium]|nr:tetratricopeptide repeat protein [Clostridiales bacterium]